MPASTASKCSWMILSSWSTNALGVRLGGSFIGRAFPVGIECSKTSVLSKSIGEAENVFLNSSSNCLRLNFCSSFSSAHERLYNSCKGSAQRLISTSWLADIWLILADFPGDSVVELSVKTSHPSTPCKYPRVGPLLIRRSSQEALATLTGRSVPLLFDSTKELPTIKPSIPVSAYGLIRPNSDPRSKEFPCPARINSEFAGTVASFTRTALNGTLSVTVLYFLLFNLNPDFALNT